MQTDRYEILRALSQDIKTSNDVNLKELASPAHTEHFTGADLKALLYNAQLTAAHAVLDQRRRQGAESGKVAGDSRSESSDSDSPGKRAKDLLLTSATKSSPDEKKGRARGWGPGSPESSIVRPGSGGSRGGGAVGEVKMFVWEGSGVRQLEKVPEDVKIKVCGTSLFGGLGLGLG